MALRMSLNCKAFRNTGTFGTPTWLEVKNIKDVVQSQEDEEGDASVRGGGGFAMSEPALRKAGVEFAMPYDPSDAALTALITAYNTRAAVDYAFLDGASSGANSQGLRANWKVFKHERNEPLAGVVESSFSFKPCYDLTNLPSWVTFA